MLLARLVRLAILRVLVGLECQGLQESPGLLVLLVGLRFLVLPALLVLLARQLVKETTSNSQNRIFPPPGPATP